MAWTGLVLTVEGRRALNQAQLSNTLNIKSIVVGDGKAPANFGTLKGLVHQLYEITAIKIDVTDDRCVVTADFPKVEYDYYFREIGVIVTTADGDKLYVYDNCGDDAQYMVNSTGVETTKKRIRLSLVISDVDNITVSEPQILYVDYDEYEGTVKRLDTHEKDETKHVTAEERKKWNEKQDTTGDAKDNTVTFNNEDAENPTSWTSIILFKSKEKLGSLFNKVSIIAKNVRYLYKIIGTTDISKVGDGTVTNAISTLKKEQPGDATQSAHGLMTAADKKKLDGIADGANKYTHPDSAAGAKTSGLYKITTDASGHVTAVTPVVKADITALGIPGTDTNTTYGGATQSAHGLMTAADKKKLDGIADGANKYTHPDSAAGAKTSGLYKITTDASGHVTAVTPVVKADITALGIPGSDTNTTYGAATQSAHGLMTAADKKKLDGIADGANKYTHPSTHAASMITQDATHRFASDTEKTTWNNKLNKMDVTQSAAVTKAGQKALDAIEKNASIDGTLAHGISQINSNLAETDLLYLRVKWIINHSTDAYGYAQIGYANEFNYVLGVGLGAGSTNYYVQKIFKNEYDIWYAKICNRKDESEAKNITMNFIVLFSKS